MALMNFGPQRPWKPEPASIEKPLRRVIFCELQLVMRDDAPDWRYMDLPRIRFMAWLHARGRIRE